MSRLYTTGFGLCTDADVFSRTIEGMAIDVGELVSSPVRSGSRSLALVGSNKYIYGLAPFDASKPFTVGRTYFGRFYLYISSGSTDSVPIMRFGVFGNTQQTYMYADPAASGTSTTQFVLQGLTANGSVGWGDWSNPANYLDCDTWHLVEWAFRVDTTTTGRWTVKQNGTTIFDSSTLNNGTVAPDQVWSPQFGSSGTPTRQGYLDHIVINDDQGASQNTFPGAGAITYLNPVADSARTGWTDHYGGTTSLFDAVDNVPPSGTRYAPGGLGVRAVGTSATTGSMTSPATLAPAIPAAAVDGDLMLCFCYFDTGATTSGQTIGISAGWTDLGVDFGSQAGSQLGKVFWRAKAAGDAAPTVTFTGATTGNSGGTAIAVIVAVQGADTTTPLGTSGAASTGASDTTTLAMGSGGFTLPAGQMLVAFGGKRDDGAANVLSGDGLTWTERFDIASTGGADAQMVMDTAAPPGSNTSITAKTATLGTAAATSATSAGRMFTIVPAAGYGAKTQIVDVTSSTTDAYAANMESYTEAGLSSDATITLVQPFMRIANGSSTTARSVGQQVVSNPVVAETTHNTPTTVASYGPRWGNVVVAPTVTMGTRPVMRVRKNVLSTDATMADAMAVIVDYVPGVPAPPEPIKRITQAVNRSAVI